VEREWWARALLVLWRPGEVFAALGSSDEEDEDARSEPLLAIVFLAGIATVLGTNAFAHALDDFELDGLTLAVIGFIAGGIYGLVAYFVLGFLAYAGARAAGSRAPWLHLRQLVGFSAVPLALSLVVVWPVRLAIYGGDVFESGGSDTGFGNHVFEALELGAIVWSLALVIIGMRAYHAWPFSRAFLASLPVLVGPLFALARAYSLL
jgi:Yip1 domain